MTVRKKDVDAVTVESILNGGVPELPDLNHLSHAEKDALIRAFWAQVQSLTARVAALEARLGEPGKTPDNSSLPPSRGQKPTSRRRSSVLDRARAALAAKEAVALWPAILTRR